MNERLAAGAAALITSVAGLAHITRLWPAPTGSHRAARVPAGVVDQAFRHCVDCGGVAAAVVHADGSHTCADGHTSRAGGTQ